VFSIFNGRSFMLRIALLTTLIAALAGPSAAQEAPKIAGTPTVVPFKLTRTQHVMVRVKIDGKGPFHFIIDTGCPALVISKETAQKAGLADDKGWGVVKKLEFEGGLSQDNVKARVETPFQIEGMNNMGLPGVELHGLMGYTVLAKYKIEIDMNRERMVWTPLAFDPPPLEKLKLKEGGAAGIEVMGNLLKVISRLAGLKPPPPGKPRGFVGVELEHNGKRLRVAAVLDGSPAAKADVKVGDELESINERKIATLADVNAAVADLPVGSNLALGILRGGERTTIKLTTASGF
jgi:hypothetical protein